MHRITLILLTLALLGFHGGSAVTLPLVFPEISVMIGVDDRLCDATHATCNSSGPVGTWMVLQIPPDGQGFNDMMMGYSWAPPCLNPAGSVCPDEAQIADEAWMTAALDGIRLPPIIEAKFLNHVMQPVPANVTLRFHQFVRFVGESVNETFPDPSVYRARWLLIAQVEE